MKIPIANKITLKHIELTSFSKMRVNLATQVLSLSVSSGIRSIVLLSNKLDKESLLTADFCEFFNNLFDIFNSKKTNTYIYKNSLKEDSLSMEFLKSADKTLSKYLNIYIGKSNLPCLVGWMSNVKSLVSLFENLNINYNINEFKTGNCNQDFVENLFSRMRSGGGNRDNPGYQIINKLV